MSRSDLDLKWSHGLGYSLEGLNEDKWFKSLLELASFYGWRIKTDPQLDPSATRIHVEEDGVAYISVGEGYPLGPFNVRGGGTVGQFPLQGGERAQGTMEHYLSQMEDDRPVESNPKEYEASVSGKTPLRLLPPTFLKEVALALKYGADKYGPWNWRDSPINLTTHLEAVMRHIVAIFDGEDTAEDSQISHLAHAAAGLAVLMDAEANGVLNDDRRLHRPELPDEEILFLAPYWRCDSSCSHMKTHTKMHPRDCTRHGCVEVKEGDIVTSHTAQPGHLGPHKWDPKMCQNCHPMEAKGDASHDLA